MKEWTQVMSFHFMKTKLQKFLVTAKSHNFPVMMMIKTFQFLYQRNYGSYFPDLMGLQNWYDYAVMDGFFTNHRKR